ncbi:MAG TPA: glycosyltransferase family 39 protein [Candidatus Nanoarchaeia archaeon]|nr:glycosyltransferase family 39 protein [Candidatus Nanoarchaeia archaeon]
MGSIEHRKNRILEFLKHKKIIILILILLLAFFIRLRYNSVNTAQWWDSADYMMGAKEIAGTDLATYEFNPRRPFFLSLLWGVILWLGGNDSALTFSVLILSLITVFYTYLIGKELFNDEVGLIAAFLLGVFWEHLFFTARLLTDIPSAAFLIMGFYHFIKGPLNDGARKHSILSGIFLGLAWFTRSASLVMLIPLFIMIFMKKKFSILKDKNSWITLGMIFVVMLPFFIFLISSSSDALKAYTGVGAGRFEGGGITGLWENLKLIMRTLTPFYYWIFYIGLFFIADCFLGLDLIGKNKDKDLANKLYLFLWTIAPWIFFGLTFNRALEDRYFMAIYPTMLIIAAYGLFRIKNYIEKFNKWAAIGFIVILLVIVSYPQVTMADDVINSRSQGFAEVAIGGYWIKENSNQNDNVISASTLQNMYYSERNTYPFAENSSTRNDPNAFLPYLEKINPRYVVISVYEQGFTPQWAYTFGNDHPELLTPVQGYANPQQQPILVIYKYNNFKESTSLVVRPSS